MFLHIVLVPGRSRSYTFSNMHTPLGCGIYESMNVSYGVLFDKHENNITVGYRSSYRPFRSSSIFEHTRNLLRNETVQQSYMTYMMFCGILANDLDFITAVIQDPPDSTYICSYINLSEILYFETMLQFSLLQIEKYCSRFIWFLENRNSELDKVIKSEFRHESFALNSANRVYLLELAAFVQSKLKSLHIISNLVNFTQYIRMKTLITVLCNPNVDTTFLRMLFSKLTVYFEENIEYMGYIP